MACLIVGPIPVRLRYAASEMPFIALMSLALYLVDSRVRRTRPLLSFGIGVLSALLFLTRYSGVVIIGVVGAALIFDSVTVRPVLWRRIVWFAMGAVPLSVAWLIRNYVFEGALLGRRATPSGPVSEALTGTASPLVDWLLPRGWWADKPLEWIIV